MNPHARKPLQPQRRSGRGKPDLHLVRPDGVDGRGSHAALELRPPDKAGSLVRPELTFQVESFTVIAPELPALFARHWHELADHQDTRPLDPDWQRYMELEAMGRLHVITARCGEVLVGYIFNLIGPHLHYKSTLHAEIEMFWLEPPYRGGWFAVKWFRENDRLLRQAGVKFIHCGVKNHYMAGRVGSIFRRLGYKPSETLWTN